MSDGFSVQCNVCDNHVTVPVHPMQVHQWRVSGEFVQNYFPDLPLNDRELLLSGTCGSCFDRMFDE